MNKVRAAKKTLLGTKHFKAISQLYLSSEEEDQAYPISLVRLKDQNNLQSMVYLPFLRRANSHREIVFQCSGFQFQVLVSSHEKETYTNLLRLKQDGTAYILVCPFRESDVYKRTVKDYQKILAKYGNKIH